ncbi:MAG: hypothetical protein IGR80_05870 [Synechococcales cyanobacterium K44_A2020_017]|uniref:hypothetical protein n=1 Tax=Leptolyngbya sp. CCY15150 TaxID=2767772 RepID=UPI00195283EB|nr:hypothetical protein [Leptolyngbya sp. CCY15150]MBF2087443.1 hypothetical protein [Synechococcales cyanobacterium K32_A2020_035]MBF2094269.1 hypothetical protein [Synechococcales cyanobacterium K44_A2020_017]
MTPSSPSPQSNLGSSSPGAEYHAPSDAEPVQVLIESSTRAGYLINRLFRWFGRLSDGSKWMVGLGAIAVVLTVLSIVLELISFVVKLALLLLLGLGSYKLLLMWRSPSSTPRD